MPSKISSCSAPPFKGQPLSCEVKIAEPFLVESSGENPYAKRKKRLLDLRRKARATPRCALGSAWDWVGRIPSAPKYGRYSNLRTTPFIGPKTTEETESRLPTIWR